MARGRPSRSAPLSARHSRGMTLMEIMIVVVIIGLLATLAFPAFNYVRQNAQNTTAANDLRQFSEAFQAYILESGTYPADEAAGLLPPEMEGRIQRGKFSRPSPIGGNYDWDYQVAGVLASVAISSPNADNAQLERLDRQLDDGDLSTGKIRFTGGALRLVVDE